MPIDSLQYDINDLAKAVGVSVRTIRFYQHNRLLRSPGMRGRGRHYSLGDLERLRLIRRLAQDGIPLAEVRRRLNEMSAAEISEAVAADRESVPPSGTLHLSHRAERRVFGLARATWERIELAPDIELHVRRPLTPAQHQMVDRLIAVARSREA